MTVSFCVIAYNEANALPSLFQDIRNQDYPHDRMEIVLVDAMSTDKTRALMEAFAEEDNGFMGVQVLENPKKIQAAGWNVAIQAATCDIIIRIDAHTMIPKEFVSKNVAVIESGEAVSGGQRPNIVEKETPWTNTMLLAESSMFGSSIAPYRTSQEKSYVKSVFHGAYRREVFEKAGLFNEYLGRTEDNEMHYRVLEAGYKICYTPSIISYQHVRGTWSGMLKQKYGNGKWIGLTLGVCPQCFSLYHFVPLCFVLAILGSILFWFLGWRLPMIALAAAYGFVDILMAVLSVRGQKKYWQYLLLPLIFLSLHIAYGVGTLVGIVKMPFWLKDYKKKTGKLK